MYVSKNRLREGTGDEGCLERSEKIGFDKEK